MVNDMHSSSRTMRSRESPRNRLNGLGMNQNGRVENKTPTEGSPQDQTEQRSKLRNRDCIAKPETLKYEPNLNKGLHARIMHSILKEASAKSKNNKNTSINKRKSETPTKDKQNGVKKAKADTTNAQSDYFDSYAFSMQLINTEDETIQAQTGKSPKEKNVLMIGNLPFDVTREQLEEHFRKTGGIKAIRIPRDRGSDKGRGVAYMEFDGRISLGIALRLHQTTLGGNKINVEFTPLGGGKGQQVKQK